MMFFGLISTPEFGRDWFGPGRRRGSVSGESGMWAFLASLAVFFIAAFVLFALCRSGAGAKWPAAGAVRLPRAGLALSTVLLVCSSGALHWASRSVRSGAQRGLRVGLLLTLLLGVGFLGSQAYNWWLVYETGPPPQTNFVVGLFYILTAMHVAHVIGGLVPLTIVTRRSFAGKYSADRHTGVRLCGMYWHFLDGVWLVMVVMLLMG